MDIEKLPDNEMKPLNIESTFIKQKRTYYLIIAALMIVNIILFVILSSEQTTLTQRFLIGLKTIALGSITLGFGLGLITALIPYGKLHYTEKYFRASLLTILTIQVVLIPLQFFGIHI